MKKKIIKVKTENDFAKIELIRNPMQVSGVCSAKVLSVQRHVERR